MPSPYLALLGISAAVSAVVSAAILAAYGAFFYFPEHAVEKALLESDFKLAADVTVMFGEHFSRYLVIDDGPGGLPTFIYDPSQEKIVGLEGSNLAGPTASDAFDTSAAQHKEGDFDQGVKPEEMDRMIKAGDIINQALKPFTRFGL